MRFKITALAVLAAMGLSAVAHAGGSGSALFGAPAYLSTSVKKNGAPHELVDGTRVRVKFVQ